MTPLTHHITAIDAEHAEALKLRVLLAERAYQAAGSDPARRARTAAELGLARWRAAHEEEQE
jgi:hypothetical protein